MTPQGADRRVAEPDWGSATTLSEILDEIRAVVDVGAATVLVLDRTRARLETKASVGFDRPVRSVPSIRIGQAFAGRVAQARQPLILNEVASDSVADPGLLTRGVVRLLGVPIVVGGEFVGVLHVGRTSSQHFVDADVLTLTSRATALGKVLAARFTNESHTAALTLQRSLLPEEIQSRPGVRIAARYIPASGDLGGDWYDVFDLPTGQLVLVMGDVVGHGLDAAVIMGRLRSALRAYALECDDPAEIIARLDRKICHFEPGALATVLVAMAEPPYEKWAMSSAGHLAPLVVSGQGRWEAAGLTVDRILGFEPTGPRRTSTVVLPEGGSLCLFTDGLVERRPTASEPADEALDHNLEALAIALRRSTEPEMACINVLSDLVGERPLEDDLALLVIQRTEGGE